MERLEKGGDGLNLTYEVRNGIVSHSKPRGDFLGAGQADGMTAEAQICRVPDAVAYLNHDLADAFRAGILEEVDLPPQVENVLGRRHSERINAMVSDIVESSWAATGEDEHLGSDRPKISMSARVRDAVNVLREFMFERVYLPKDRGETGETARRIVRLLYAHYSQDSTHIPPEYDHDGTGVVDYIAGMTDRYAMRAAEAIAPGISGPLRAVAA